MNFIKGLGLTIEEDSIIQKIFRTSPPRFYSKLSILEGITSLDKLTENESHGVLTTYEMRTDKYSGFKKEVIFKAMRKYKNNKHEFKKSSDIFDEKEANFMRKLKRGHGNYKGKFPFKCFKCGRT